MTHSVQRVKNRTSPFFIYCTATIGENVKNMTYSSSFAVSI